MFDLKNYIVTPADEWTRLFKRTSGWFGGDGIFSFSINGVESADNLLDSSVIYFSDTFVGDVVDGKPENYTMVHNSFAKPSIDSLSRSGAIFTSRGGQSFKLFSLFTKRRSFIGFCRSLRFGVFGELTLMTA